MIYAIAPCQSFMTIEAHYIMRCIILLLLLLLWWWWLPIWLYRIVWFTKVYLCICTRMFSTKPILLYSKYFYIRADHHDPRVLEITIAAAYRVPRTTAKRLNITLRMQNLQNSLYNIRVCHNTPIGLRILNDVPIEH